MLSKCIIDIDGTKENIDLIFENIRKKETNNITIYFHGGLVNEESGLKTAKDISKFLQETSNYPICFIWKTGLIEILSDKINKIAEKESFKKIKKFLVKNLSQIIITKNTNVNSRSIFNVSRTDEINKELLKENPFKNYKIKFDIKDKEIQNLFIKENFKDLQEIKDLLIKEKNTTIKFKINSRSIISPTLALEVLPIIHILGKITKRIIKRFRDKRHHDFYPTIIEEILREFYLADLGSSIWQEMKEKSNNIWDSTGAYFLEKLMEYSKENKKLNVNLVGHSAGSIAICNLLRVTENINDNFKYNKIIFMAPACRVDLFKKEIVDKQNRFKDFRMFTMKDKYEVKDILVPNIYTHSLLYLVSGILENNGQDFDAHILGLERHISGEEPYISSDLLAVNKFIYEDGKNRVVFSKTSDEPNSKEGLKTDAIKHGGFHGENLTRDSIKYFLTH